MVCFIFQNFIFSILIVSSSSVTSSNSNEFTVTKCYFIELESVKTAVVNIDVPSINMTAQMNTFENCNSQDGTCALKISCKFSKIYQNCFAHLKTHYVDATYDGGAAISARGGNFDIADGSMIDVVQSDISTHAALLVCNSQCEVSRLNNSFGSMKNAGTYSNSWNIIDGSSFFGSYCVFFHLEGGTCIVTLTATSGQCDHLVFSSVTCSGKSYLINNPLSTFLIDECICMNSNAVSSSAVQLSRWYFKNCQNVGKIFANTLSSPEFELNILMTKRCDLGIQSNYYLCKKNEVATLISLLFFQDYYSK